MSVLKRSELEQSSLSDLHALASELGLEGYRRLRKGQLIDALLGEAGSADDEPAGDGPEDQPDEADPTPAPEAEDEEPEDEEEEEEEEEEGEDDFREGTLDVLPNGSGFVRNDPFSHGKEDVYVSPAQIRRCELRAGDSIGGPVRPPRRSERYPSLVRVENVNGGPAEPPAERPSFDKLTAVRAESSGDLPKGGRVAVTGDGASARLRELAGAADKDSLTVVLAGALPEDVTEWSRAFEGVPVAGGSFDRPLDEQAQAAEVAVELAKRVAERGGHAVVVVDSLDALSGGAARRVFGAGRATEEAGSVTVVAAVDSPDLVRLATARIDAA